MLSTVFSEQSVRAWFDIFIDTEGSDGGVEYNVLAYWRTGVLGWLNAKGCMRLSAIGSKADRGLIASRVGEVQRCPTNLKPCYSFATFTLTNPPFSTL
jgi:hypothetical protein